MLLQVMMQRPGHSTRGRQAHTQAHGPDDAQERQAVADRQTGSDYDHLPRAGKLCTTPPPTMAHTREYTTRSKQPCADGKFSSVCANAAQQPSSSTIQPPHLPHDSTGTPMPRSLPRSCALMPAALSSAPCRRWCREHHAPACLPCSCHDLYTFR